MECYFEPVTGKGAERRDELGNTAPYRSQPHRGSDWGFSNGSHRKPALAVHSGIVERVFENGPLGHSVIVRMVCTNRWCEGVRYEYNHFDEASKLKVGDQVVGGRTVIGLIGATGTSISNKGANHLHASAAPAPVPHEADRKVLIDLFKRIDISVANRKKVKP
jgi:murein DD-endopeptidase MepM/ murein hydrolase activator NlpD